MKVNQSFILESNNTKTTEVSDDNKPLQNYGIGLFEMNDTVLVGMYIKIGGSNDHKAEFYDVELNGMPVEN